MTGDGKPKVAMTGATGFVGGHLRKDFESRGWSVKAITREDLKGTAEGLAGVIEGHDAIVNLAGAPILARWSREYKDVLRSSRIETTRKVVEAMGLLNEKPRVLVSTSAVGIYGSGGIFTEKDFPSGNDFLGRLASDWEAEAMKAENFGVRTVILRLGVVLGADGGALKTMLTPFKMGLGGKIGNGRQGFSWVHIDDVISAYRSAIENSAYKGAYNLTAPEPITNGEFTHMLASALSRPAVLSVPVFALRLQFGEGAEVLAKGQRVVPERLVKEGFSFRFPDAESALADIFVTSRKR